MNENWHPNFIEYIQEIVAHPNYEGLPIERNKNGELKWLAPVKGKNPTGRDRVRWADEKAKELGFQDSSKKYADVMLALHPTKVKVCQWCGESMKLNYLYPTANTKAYLLKKFNIVCSKYESIQNITLNNLEYEDQIKSFLIKKGDLDSSFHSKTIDDVILVVEDLCRNGNKQIFSPGAMSNFPDRFDGFHSYNLCCRKFRDKGRHSDNMATYNKDRRAYEYWSDGNIAAANIVMRDKYLFKDATADHIGPISLGFKHDPLFLQQMSSSDNSSKRDRLLEIDLQTLIKIEEENKVSSISFFAEEIWQFIKYDFQQNHTLTMNDYRNILKLNMLNFMESLWILFDTKDKNKINIFFRNNFFAPKYEEFFRYTYSFDEKGRIKEKTARNITVAGKQEFDRYVRIALESVSDFHLKSESNRSSKPILTDQAIETILKLQTDIINNPQLEAELYIRWKELIKSIQDNLLILYKE